VTASFGYFLVLLKDIKILANFTHLLTIFLKKYSLFQYICDE